jgi:hypothetical protein
LELILDIRFRLSRQRARFAPGIMAAVLTLRTTGGRPRHEKLVQGDYCPAVFNPSLTICGAAGVILGQDYGADCPGFIEDLETEVADFETGGLVPSISVTTCRAAACALRRLTLEHP